MFGVMILMCTCTGYIIIMHNFIFKCVAMSMNYARQILWM